MLVEWVKMGRPLIVRRPCLNVDGTIVSLGLALPPAPQKRRLAFEVPRSCIADISDPPRWQDCVSADQVGPLFPILSRLESVHLRAFGSHAWQHLTGLPYVTACSDVDLLAFAESAEAWDGLRRALERTEWPPHPRVDLEVVLRRDASFLWREFVTTSDRLLFKGNARVWLGDKNDVPLLLQDPERGSGQADASAATVSRRGALRLIRAEEDFGLESDHPASSPPFISG